MGFDDGGIILDKHDLTYYTGQVVRGKLEFDLSNVKKFRGIYVEFKGYCKVHWTTSHSRRENDRTVHYTVVHESYEEYINLTTYLVGSKSGETQLHPGRHAFPFEFLIPPHCPSSFEASNGHIRYQVKATCDRAFKLDQHKTAIFRVLAPIDLNANPYCKEPFGIEFYNSYCCWCLNAGKCEITVKVPYGGACPKQIVPIELSCKNDSTVEIDAIRFQIRKVFTFHALREPDSRSGEDTIIEVKKGPVPERTERNWVVDLQIPDMEVPNMTGCRFIEVDYKFKVLIETSGCHKDDDETRPFIIGTIPLNGYGTQPIAPTENNPVAHEISSYPPVMNQPITGNPPYPNGANISPYPASPYPNQPYPGANPPYPNSSPYPSNPTPFPGNTPYPPSTSPYPTPKVGNAPYPTDSNAPYPPTSSPYPPTSSPYPPNSSPYPPTTSPYPPSVPYGNSPGFTGTTLLKTGNVGFIGNKTDGATMPLLPPGGGMPPYPASPFASASAPAVPSTPNDEGNKFGYTANNSPYNPEFKDN